MVRDGKGYKDRLTMLPQSLIAGLQLQLQFAQRLFQFDLSQGYGEASLPYALAQKYPNLGRTWGWQYVFPSHKRSLDPMSHRVKRHHLHEQTLFSTKGERECDRP
ncbi:hypothetical protein [Lyngbya confervoides]|uniref:Uncharacterized protein n=1 Tax=Lyngbya confervoides BDU141951 TaxID=1574623 RepID=A0ABD4T2K4_9CYAN|nr:hypothetical protein [Lyngbya confervoides]MCM1982884.1 hypothetical protein [Lyngbya confervoides BDU141951]